jgi:hypothetical protein
MRLTDFNKTFLWLFIALGLLQVFALIKSNYFLPNLESRIWPFLVLIGLLLILTYLLDARFLRKLLISFKKEEELIHKKVSGKKKSFFKLKSKKLTPSKRVFFNFRKIIAFKNLILIKSRKALLLLLLRLRKFNDVKYLINFFFQFFLIIYLILLLVNEFNYFTHFNSTWVLIPTIVFGIITAIFSKEEKERKEDMKTFDKILVWFLALIGMILIFIKTKDLGWLSYVISVISGVLIVLVGYLIYEDDGEEEKEVYISVTKKTIIWFSASLILLSSILSIFLGLSAFRIVFGSAFVLFIPGFIISYLFFSKKGKEIGALERIALSFALSISIIPLLVFYLNLIGMRINALNVSLVILGVCLISVYFIKINIAKKWNLFFKKKSNKKRLQ